MCDNISFGRMILMKKLTAILLVAMLLFMSACTTADITETPTDAPSAQNITLPSQGATAQQTMPGEITDWSIPELPADFPAPPAGMSLYSHSITKGESVFYPKDVEVIEISFTCQKVNFIEFTNSLLEAGYKGGCVQIKEGKEYFREGYLGGWQNGKTAVIIFNTIEIDKNLVTYYINVSECGRYFPSGLEGIIPRFDGYSIHTGAYTFLNSKDEFEYAELPKDLSRSLWNITHTSADYNAFLGVSTSEFNDYCNEIGKAGFTCETMNDNYDGANVIFFDAYKVINGKTYTVQLLYNSSASMLEAIYTNC